MAKTSKSKQKSRGSTSSKQQTASARANAKGRNPDRGGHGSGSLDRPGVRSAARRGKADYRKSGDLPDKATRRQAKRQHAR